MIDPLVDRVLFDLAEHFGDVDDDDEAPFGEHARVVPASDARTNTLVVWHQTEPVGVRITVEKINRQDDHAAE